MGRGDTRWSPAVAKCAAAFARWVVRLLGPYLNSAASQTSTFANPTSSRRLAIFAALVSLAAATPLVSLIAAAQERPFNPIRKLTTPPTDRSVVDLEIVGSTSLLPEVHKLEPERVLRFRLERAYIDTLLTRAEPGFEIMSFRFDTKTSLPMSLFDAVSLRGPFHEDISGIPDLSHLELIQRALAVSLTSDMSASTLEHGSENIAKCRGAEKSNGLFAYNWEANRRCFLPSYKRGSQYVVHYKDRIFTRIVCRNKEFPSLDCDLLFPFDNFGVRVNFNHVHLADWEQVIDRSTEFMRSKQYR